MSAAALRFVLHYWEHEVGTRPIGPHREAIFDDLDALARFAAERLFVDVPEDVSEDVAEAIEAIMGSRIGLVEPSPARGSKGSAAPTPKPPTTISIRRICQVVSLDGADLRAALDRVDMAREARLDEVVRAAEAKVRADAVRYADDDLKSATAALHKAERAIARFHAANVKRRDAEGLAARELAVSSARKWLENAKEARAALDPQPAAATSAEGAASP